MIRQDPRHRRFKRLWARLSRIALLGLLCVSPIGQAWIEQAWAQGASPAARWPQLAQSREDGGQKGSSAQRSGAERASRIARERSGGGRVLNLTPSKDGYRVKVLTPAGEVRELLIPGR